jgi:hypothetical protein
LRQLSLTLDVLKQEPKVYCRSRHGSKHLHCIYSLTMAILNSFPWVPLWGFAGGAASKVSHS